MYLCMPVKDTYENKSLLMNYVARSPNRLFTVSFVKRSVLRVAPKDICRYTKVQSSAETSTKAEMHRSVF